MFFFLLWPLFARAPRHWFLENFLLSAPGVQSVFFLLRSVGRRDLSAGPEQKKKHHPGCAFFCSGPGERQGKEKPRWKPARGQSKKKHHPGCFFFCSGPGERQGKEKPRWAPARGQSKKSFFFWLWPRAGAQRGFSFPKKNTLGGVFFFCSGPVPASNGASPSLAFRRGRSKKKKHPGWCFFFCSGPVPASNGASPSLAFRRGRSKKKKKKNTLGGVFFFAAAPRGRSVTHCGPGWRCARTGVVFFFLLWPRPDAHSLTVGWGDFGKARVVFFVCCGPAGSF